MPAIEMKGIGARDFLKNSLEFVYKQELHIY